MKKTFIILAALLCGTATSFALDANRLSYVQILPAQEGTNSTETINGTGVDVSVYKGNAAFLVQIGAGATNYTGTVTLEHSTTLGSGYITITNLAGTAGVLTLTGATGSVQSFPCDLGRLHKYVRATVGYTNDTASVGVILTAPASSN